MLTLIIVGGGVLLFLAFGGAPMLKRVGKAFMAQVNRGSHLIGNADPVANRQFKIDQAADTLRGFNEKLADLKGKETNLRDLLSQYKADEKRLLNAAKLAKDAGDTDGAREIASDVIRLRKKIDDTQNSLGSVAASYNDTRDRVKAEKTRVLEAKDRLRDQRDRLDLANLNAAIEETRSTLNVSVDLDADADDKAIEERINRTNAKILVAEDLADPVPARQKYAALEHDAAADELLDNL